VSAHRRPLRHSHLEPFPKGHPLAGSYLTTFLDQGVSAIITTYSDEAAFKLATLQARIAESRFDGPTVVGGMEKAFPNGDRFGLIVAHEGPMLGPKSWARYHFSRQNITELRRTLEEVAKEFPDYADRVALQRDAHEGVEWFRLRVLPVAARRVRTTPPVSVDHFLAEHLARSR
jgi:hypothetical protein